MNAPARVTIQEIVNRSEYSGKHGTMAGYQCRAETDSGETVMIDFSAKPESPVAVGDSFVFQPNGQTFGVYSKGKREQGTLSRGTANAHRATQSASTGGGGTQGSPARQVPTMSQAVAVLKECIEAVKEIGGSDAHGTTLFLARLRGDIRRDPTSAEIEAAKAAAAKAAEEAAKEAERLAAEAAKAQALAAMPPMADDDDIPFSFMLAPLTGLLLAAHQFIA